MTYVKISPNSTVHNDGGWSPTPLHSKINDGVESTYITSTVANGTSVVGFGTYTITGSQRIGRIRIVAQTFSSPSRNLRFRVGNYASGSWHTWSTITAGTLATDNGPWLTTAPSGSEWSQSAVDNIEIGFQGDVSSGNTARIVNLELELDIRDAPTVVATNFGSIITTHQPTLSWTPTIGNNQAQIAYQVRVYDRALNASATATDAVGLVWDSGRRDGTSTTRRVGIPLPDGNYRYFVRVAKNFNDADWWSAWSYDDFSISVVPGLPTITTPAAGAIVTTNLPNLAATIPAAPTDDATLAPNTATADIQLATDAAFTTNVRTFPGTDFFAVAATVESVVPSTDALFPGTWYVRARTRDQYGSVSAWSTGNTFTIQHVPTAILQSPRGGITQAYSATGNLFDWDFSSTSPDETQSAYQLIVEDNYDGTQLVDTGKVSSVNTEATVIVPSGYVDNALRWKVRLWDAHNSGGPYSDYAAFQVAQPGTLVITAPTTTIESPQPTVTWSFNAPGGRTQAAWRLRMLGEYTGGSGTSWGAVSYVSESLVDTGWRYEPATRSYQIADSGLIHNGESFTFELQVRDSGNLEVLTSVDAVASWVPPATPSLSADVSIFDEFGYVDLQWSTAQEDADWVSYHLYRRKVGESSWVLLSIDNTITDIRQYRDYLCAANTSYEYAVTQFAERYGLTIESTLQPVTVTTDSTHYWLLLPEDIGQSVKLTNVVEESFTEEYETVELNIAGRGRKVDYGDRYGVRGTLGAQIRSDLFGTAREKLQAIRSTKSERSPVVLRNPFGDMWYVSLGDIGVSRIAGVGLDEMVDVSIPYAEVYE